MTVTSSLTSLNKKPQLNKVGASFFEEIRGNGGRWCIEDRTIKLTISK
jgi:hypothetical protein